MITIFTPTYNRDKLLWRTFESLQKQTENNFVWLVVDDGSVDDTKDNISKMRNAAKFPIIYIYQENGGKHRAFNLAVRKCNTEYMLILDSDDMLKEDAIKILNEECKIISGNDEICGIIGNRGNIDGDGVIGVKLPDIKFASGLELYQKLGFRGDTLRLYKISVLRQYPFPEICGENFISESVVFDKIDQEYRMLVIHDILYLGEYQEDGLTRNMDKIKIKNPVGYSYFLHSMAMTALTLRRRIGGTILYIIWTKKFRIKHSFINFENKFLYLLCLPISYAMYVLRKPVLLFNVFRGESR